MTYWTYAQVKAKVEEDLDTTDEIFITDSELMGYCNEAINMAEAEIHTLYEDYFFTKANIALVTGTSSYALPLDIYANKIREIVYDDGSGTAYEIKNIKDSKSKYTNIRYAEVYDLDSDYRYYITNVSAAAGVAVNLVPKSRVTQATYVTIYYIRNANPIAVVGDKIDVPEFVDFIMAYMRYKCLLKEGHPNAEAEASAVQTLMTQMKETLSQMVIDGDLSLPGDFDLYDDFYNNGQY